MKQAGVQELKDFLDPKHRDIPLVCLPKSLNPYYDQGIMIYTYLLYMNPLFHVKAIPSWYLVQESLQKSGTASLVENSSGNTAMALTVFARVLGNIPTKAIVSHEVIPAKRKFLEFFGTDIYMHQEPICPNPNDPTSGIHLAKKMEEEVGVVNPGQYDNEINWKSHYRITGPQLFEKLPSIDYFIASLGTTGTMLGSSQYLKEKKQCVTTIGVVRKENNPIPGPRTLGLLDHIAFDRESSCDEVYTCSSYDAFYHSKLLSQHGILAGPSSGMQYAIALEKAKELVDNGITGKHLVFVGCDTCLPYIDEYEKYLGSKEQQVISLTIDGNRLEQLLGDSITKYEIIDLRTHQQYHEFHIPGSRHISFHHIDEFIDTVRDKKTTYIFVCVYGSKSEIIAKYMQTLGFEAKSLAGGILEWNNSGKKICKHKHCHLRINTNDE